MTGEDRKAVAVQLLDAIAQKDVATLERVLDEDIQWWVPLSLEARGMQRPLTGRDSVVSFIGVDQGFYRLGSLKWTVQHIIAEDDLVAAHVTGEAVTFDGRQYRNEYHLLLRFQGSRVVEFWEGVDTAFAFDLLRDHPLVSRPSSPTS